MFPDFLQSGNEWINDNNAVLVDLCGNSSSSPSLQCSYAFLTLLPSFAAWYPSTPLNRWFHALEDETRLNGLWRGHNLCLWTLSQITASCRHAVISSSCSYLPRYCEFLDTFSIPSCVQRIHWPLNTHQNCPANSCCQFTQPGLYRGPKKGVILHITAKKGYLGPLRLVVASWSNLEHVVTLSKRSSVQFLTKTVKPAQLCWKLPSSPDSFCKT